MIDSEVILLAHSTHDFLIPGFAYLFNKYWSPTQPVTLFIDRRPMVPLPSNFRILEISNYSFNNWTDSVFDALNWGKSKRVILFLEDYWLTDYVRIADIYYLESIFPLHPGKILRIDLSGDRASQKYTVLGRTDSMTIIETPANSPYQMSFQVAIWDRINLLSVLKLGENAHEAEIYGSERLASSSSRKLKVLGTLNPPVSYRPIYRFKQHMLNLGRINPDDRSAIDKLYSEYAISLSPSR